MTPRRSEDDPQRLEGCWRELGVLLATGPRPASEAEALLQEQGFSASMIRKAREGISISRRVGGVGGEWMWELVPELKRRIAAETQVGVGQCSRRGPGQGHVWESWHVDENRPCFFCGRWGRRNPITQPLTDGDGRKLNPPGYYELATAGRSDIFSHIRTPESAKGVKPKEA